MISASTSTFADPGRESQQVFRAAMRALAEPCKLVELMARVSPPDGLTSGAAALLLTLADFETSVWLDAVTTVRPEICGYLKFHTGTRMVKDPDQANFALITFAGRMPKLYDFAQGVPEYPDRSTTLIVETTAFNRSDWACKGPGIAGTRTVGAAGVPSDFINFWEHNRLGFPLGVDILFVCGHQIAGLPRTTRLTEA